jgi:pilus assembly protein FimV
MDFKRWQVIAGMTLLVASAAASALSLGRVRGTPLVGRSLDLNIQATIDAQEPVPEPGCLMVDVFYGDSRVPPSAVSVSTDRAGGSDLRIRVRASTLVDEPVVTLLARSSCGASVSRRYVLLAEALTEADTYGGIPVASASTPTAPSRPAVTAKTAASDLQVSPASGGPTDRTSSNSARTRSAERAATRRQAIRQARAQQATEAASQQPASDVPPPSSKRSAPPTSVLRKSANAETPRLKIDLVDLTTVVPSLRNSAELSTVPSSDQAVRSQAQALWRILNASPEDVMRESQRLDALESQLRKAQEQNKRQSQDIVSLTGELQTAQKARYNNPFTIALALLALAALGASVYFWRRSRNTGQPWWGGSSVKAGPQDERHLWKHLGDTPDSLMHPLPNESSSSPSSNQASLNATLADNSHDASAGRKDSAQQAAPTSMRVAERANGAQAPQSSVEQRTPAITKAVKAAASSNTGRNAGSADHSQLSDVKDVLLARAGNKNGGNSGFSTGDFAPSAFNTPRVVAAEELFDIQEQADFFLSLGQPDQAIEVLKNHITDNVETSALAYMDLFDIYHRTDRQAEYSQLREEFNRVFNAQVPEFFRYGAQSNGLEDFPQVLSNIQAVWSRSAQAQDVIEESIFRQPEQDQTLDMAAYRELMLLYALAKELSRPDAAYSMLPISIQSPVLASAELSNAPDVDLSDGLVLSSPLDDLLSPDDRTVSFPHPSPEIHDDADHSLDFDLSEPADLSIIKSLDVRKKS